jgi:hypothetical protein
MEFRVLEQKMTIPLPGFYREVLISVILCPGKYYMKFNLI